MPDEGIRIEMTTGKRIQNPRERRGMTRAVPGGPVARSAIGLATAVGVACGIVGVFGAGPAAADPVSRTLKYTCSFPLINDQRGTVQIDADIPKSATVGEPTPTFVINGVTPVSAAAAKGLRLIGVRAIEGRVDAEVGVSAPQGDFDVKVPFDVTRTGIPASASFAVKATGAAPSRTFNRPGKAEITVGDLVLHLAPEDASGNLTVPGKLNVPCRLDGGQNNVVASFDITGTRPTTGSAASGTTGATGATGTSAFGTTWSQLLRRTGSAPAGTTPWTMFGSSGTTTGSASGDGTPASARYASDRAREGSSADGSPRTSDSRGTTGGQDFKGLILLAVGVLVVGTLVVARRFPLRLVRRVTGRF